MKETTHLSAWRCFLELGTLTLFEEIRIDVWETELAGTCQAEYKKWGQCIEETS